MCICFALIEQHVVWYSVITLRTYILDNVRNSQGDETGYGTLAVRWTEENSAVARGQITMGRFEGTS